MLCSNIYSSNFSNMNIDADKNDKEWTGNSTRTESENKNLYN